VFATLKAPIKLR